jgi:hypothetical protein
MRWTVPMMDQFLRAKTQEDFKRLMCKYGAMLEASMDFIGLLNHVVTYPVIFQILRGASKMPTKTAAV